MVLVDRLIYVYVTPFKCPKSIPGIGFSEYYQIGGSASKESTGNMGDLDSIPGLGRSPGEGKDYPLQYSDLENSMDCI